MASIRKSFSFRNGVQVDEDNFIVNANGLVGIGTSVPSEFLDVRGTAKVVGLVTANDVFVSGVATITDIKVGTAISITGGGVKAANFYGDGATLSNLPTSQWEDVNLGLGFTSIYAAGNVGIATTDPRQSFQVGGDPAATGKLGVGINSIGNIRASGIITASSFVGAIAGPVTGDVTGDVTGNVTGNTAGHHTGNVTGNINSTGISTFKDDVNFEMASNPTGMVVDVSANALKFADSMTIFMGDSDDLQLEHEPSPLERSVVRNNGGGDLFLQSNSNVQITHDNADNTLAKFTKLAGVELYHSNAGTPTVRVATTNSGVNVTGVVTATESIKVGTSGTVFSALNTGKVGVGSAIPGSDLTVRKATNTSVEVVSDSGVPKVSIGYSVGAEKSTGILRFGNEPNSFDIVNNDTGDLNFILDGDSNSGTGDIKFLKATSEKMRLTSDGKLGVGVTNPLHPLHVSGIATVSSNLFVGSNLDVKGTITGQLAPNQTIQANIFTTSGISTFNNVNFTGPIGFNSGTPATSVDFSGADSAFKTVGIGTTNSGQGILDVKGIGFVEQLGINTAGMTTATGFEVGRLQVHGSKIALFNSGIQLDNHRNSQIGFGTAGDTPEGVLDLHVAGASHPTPWFRLPELTTTRRNSRTNDSAASGITTGSIIYNVTSKRVEVYIPPTGANTAQPSYWVGLATVA